MQRPFHAVIIGVLRPDLVRTQDEDFIGFAVGAGGFVPRDGVLGFPLAFRRVIPADFIGGRAALIAAESMIDLDERGQIVRRAAHAEGDADEREVITGGVQVFHAGHTHEVCRAFAADVLVHAADASHIQLHLAGFSVLDGCCAVDIGVVWAWVRGRGAAVARGGQIGHGDTFCAGCRLHVDGEVVRFAVIRLRKRRDLRDAFRPQVDGQLCISALIES